MSTRVMGLVWDLQMPQSAKAVLVSLADQCNDDFQCYPSVGSISRRTCLSERTVQVSLAWLESNGYLRREWAAGRTTLYVLTVGPKSPEEGVQISHPHDRNPRRNCTPTPAKVAPTPAKVAPKPSYNRQLVIQEKRKDARGDAEQPALAQASVALPDWLDAGAWAEWEQHRRELRKPLTASTRAKQIERLAGFRARGFDPKELIDTAIAGGWQGLYAPADGTRLPPRLAPPPAPSAARVAAAGLGSSRNRSDVEVFDVVETSDVRQIAG